MAELRAKESGTRGALRIVRLEARKALEELTARWPPSDESIHEARKRLKKARAGLRLLRPALGARAYRRENQALRDAARPLSEIRDAKILIEALDRLTRDATAADRKALEGLRELLETRRARMRRLRLGSPWAFAPVVERLRRARRRVRESAIDSRGWSVLGRAVTRVYRAGRKAYSAARGRPSVEGLHEWRKQTKYLWHALEMLRPIRPAVMNRLAERMHRLSDRLGDDHDLAVLQRQIVTASARIPRAAHASISKAITQRRKRLQAQAMFLGSQLYAERPRAFVDRLEDHWRRWRSANGRR